MRLHYTSMRLIKKSCLCPTLAINKKIISLNSSCQRKFQICEQFQGNNNLGQGQHLRYN